jgi:hypothetical protein
MINVRATANAPLGCADAFWRAVATRPARRVAIDLHELRKVDIVAECILNRAKLIELGFLLTPAKPTFVSLVLIPKTRRSCRQTLATTKPRLSNRFDCLGIASIGAVHAARAHKEINDVIHIGSLQRPIGCNFPVREWREKDVDRQVHRQR